MRLIDADALKEIFLQDRCGDNFLPKHFVISTIDNAPTVEPPKQLVLRARDDAELEQLKTAWGKGEINFTPIAAWIERPHGKWNYLQAGTCICPFCGAMPHTFYKNYCAKCGAELKGGTE